jgi:hypothetical protein
MSECSTHEEKPCSCQCHQCNCCGTHDKHTNFEEYFFEVADAAWEEVLKDKIKEYISSTQDDRMTELAKIVAEGNNQRWKSKMEKKRCCSDFRDKLHSFFSHFKK